MTAPAKSGAGVAHVGYGNTRTVSFSTTGADKQIFAFLYADSAVTNLSFGGGGLTWIKLGQTEATISNKNSVQIWTARAATAITNQTLTMTCAGGNTSLALFVQAWEGCPDYTGLVANTHFGIGSYNATTETMPNPLVSVTTIGGDSELIGVTGLLFWENGYTAIANTTFLNTTYSPLVERSDFPLAAGSYNMGVIHNSGTANWRATVGIFVEILGVSGGGGGDPTAYFLTVSGSITSTGGIKKKISKSPKGTLTLSGGISKRLSRKLVGSSTMSGGISKRIRKTLSGITTMSGGISKRITRGLQGVITLSGTVTQGVALKFLMSGSMSMSGSISKSIRKGLSGSLTLAGGISKRITKTLTGSLTMVGIVRKRITRKLSGSLTLSAVIQVSTRTKASFAGAITMVGNIASVIRPFIESIGGAIANLNFIRRFIGRR